MSRQTDGPVDPDLWSMTNAQAQQLTYARNLVRKALNEINNDACHVDFMVAAILILPKDEREKAVKMILEMPRETFLKNCAGFFDCFHSLTGKNNPNELLELLGSKTLPAFFD